MQPYCRRPHYALHIVGVSSACPMLPVNWKKENRSNLEERLPLRRSHCSAEQFWGLKKSQRWRPLERKKGEPPIASAIRAALTCCCCGGCCRYYYFIITIIMSRSYLGIALHWSVCPSVCPVPAANSTTKTRKSLRFGSQVPHHKNNRPYYFEDNGSVVNSKNLLDP